MVLDRVFLSRRSHMVGWVFFSSPKVTGLDGGILGYVQSHEVGWGTLVQAKDRMGVFSGMHKVTGLDGYSRVCTKSQGWMGILGYAQSHRVGWVVFFRHRDTRSDGVLFQSQSHRDGWVFFSSPKVTGLDRVWVYFSSPKVTGLDGSILG